MSRTLIPHLTLAAILTTSVAHSAEPTFIPLSTNQGDSETRTGMWFSLDLGTLKGFLSLETCVSATKQSVTGGVAMKCVFEKGSRGLIAYENPPGVRD